MATKSERRKFSSCTIGTKFQPYNDQDLISYLQKFVCGMPIESDRIRHIDVYGNKKPCELFQDLLGETSTDHVNYIFTQLKKKSDGGKNYNRSITGGGSWKGRDTGKPVRDKEGSVIGLKKTFRFDEESDIGNNQRIVWSMKEYCLSDARLEVLRQRSQIRHEDSVLCSIEKKVNLCKNSQDISSSSSATIYCGWSLYTELTKLPPFDGPFESLTEEELAFFDNPDPGYSHAYENIQEENK
ncbi:NAC domain-containing protein 78-like [Nicotiana tabacum]|uniref:NAC domain-containing protein 2-like n=2 Tax=Nicotiana TaxID=4085 RepID=A0A1S4CH84_TOBAC|nr:PREDICTED: NAC domain-containing protein 2-like [Nicotiana sylvestris]XP_016500359.1 PREDICTED: NAC domain-containing protein 2-like [Nicotiana tabacum]